jgi:membrane-associated protease RseP (regulator of RpoE activity)
MTENNQLDPEEAHYRRNRVLKVLGFVLALCLACGIGMVLGGVLIFGLTQVGDLISQDQASDPQQGITIERRIEKELGEELGDRARPGGAVIIEVVPDSPADDAGLQEGDLIIAVDGEELDIVRDLAAAIGGHEPGDRVVLEIERPGEGSERLPVTLGSHPDKKGAAYLGVTYADSSGSVLPGSGMPALPPMDEFDFDRMPFPMPEGGVFQGALVVQVVDDSPAAAAGLTEGDVITALDGEPIEGPEALSQAVAEHEPGDKVILTVFGMGDGQEQEIQVTLAENPDDEGRGYLGVSISGFLRMERHGDPSGPGRFHFRYGEPGSEFDWDEMPFDPEDLPFNWDEMPFDLDDLPFDLDELPVDPEDFRRHLQLDDRSA